MNLILVILIIFILVEIPISIGMGLIFKKINLEFKKGIIPFLNKIELIKHYRLPMYHLILIFIPIIGLYTNYEIYKMICKQTKKEFMYVLELTFFPFIYNIILGLELKEQNEKNIDNYFEDQKNLYQKEPKEKKETKDEYVWKPIKKTKANNVYKASRNKTINKKNKNEEIIDNKKEIEGIKKTKHNTKICPKCGAKMMENAEICFLCGTKF